jgi:hypothetical protein
VERLELNYAVTEYKHKISIVGFPIYSDIFTPEAEVSYRFDANRRRVIGTHFPL